MVYVCRAENCSKSFSTKSNRNKHEKKKGHGPIPNCQPIIERVDDIYVCPTDGCSTKSKYKANIVKHLKYCDKLLEKRENSKTCSFCGKVFAQKSNRDRHVQNTHINVPITDKSQESEVEMVPSMAFDRTAESNSDVSDTELDGAMLASGPVQNESFVDIDYPELLPVNPLPNDTVNIEIEERKRSRLEQALSNIKQSLDYSMNVSESVIL